MAALIGSVLGCYRVESRLGASATGDVFRACHLHTGQARAVRVLAADMRHSPELRAAFHQEAQLAAMLHHPHIVRVYESGEWHDHGYLVMEYLPAGSLAALLARVAATGRPIALGLALAMARQCADGLSYAHRYGVAHGDLRPATLMVEREAGRAGPLRLKIRDFGLARLGVEMLAVGGLAAPPLYLAPEQYQGIAPDTRSDIYGVGLILYELLAGRPAFPGATYAEAARRQLSQPPPSLREARPGLPPAVESLVARCLAHDPHARPAGAAELVAELAAIVATHARPAGAAA